MSDGRDALIRQQEQRRPWRRLSKQAQAHRWRCLILKVSPKASRNAITGFMGEVLKVSVTAAPEKGKANRAVEELLAEALGLPLSAVSVVAGHTAKTKRVEITGLAEATLRRQLCTIVERGARPGR